LPLLSARFPAAQEWQNPIPRDKALYRERNVIERMFCRLKYWRRTATRFDRNAKTFPAALAIATAVVWRLQ
jgi:transposase